MNEIMELSNSHENFLNLSSLIKKELKIKLETSQNIASSSYEYDFPTKQEYFYVKEEIDIEWDENHNNEDEGNKLLCENDNQIIKLDAENTCGPILGVLDQTKKTNSDDNLETKKSHQKNCKEYMFNKFCVKCKKTSKNIGDKCRTCQHAMSFECKICHKKTNSLPGIINHLNTKCNILWYYQCPDCDYRSPKKYRMIKHTKRIHPKNGSSMYEDNVCWKKVYNDTEKNSLYKCSECKKMFTDYKKLNDHYQNCTISMTKLPCRNKDKVTQELASSNFKNKNSVRQMTMYYCERCKKETEVENFKIKGQQCCFNCGSNLMFKCVKCKKLYKLYETIVYHLKAVCNSQKTLQCSECDYTASFLSLINKHYRSTHERKISSCSTCGGEYKNPESLRKHLYVCKGTIYYRCHECNYKTKIKSRLSDHIAKHLQES